MIPASLVGVLFLAALAPGVIFLNLTDKKRSPTGDPTVFEELLTLVVAGAVTTLPPLLLALVVLPDQIQQIAATANGFEGATNHEIRGVGIFVLAMIAVSIVLALICAWGFNSISKIDAAPDVWGPTLAELEADSILMVGVKLRDGTFIQGASAGYSTGKNGRDRDLALGKPISVQLIGRDLKERTLGRAVISESQIAYFTTSLVPRLSSTAGGAKGSPDTED